ncbi:MAG: BMC domain-containing protein [Eubacteriales bacterium]|nr:BMC domain-containing protein [Eubacteriales bacterium]
MRALGMIETRGYLTAVCAADAMLKAAEVSLAEKITAGAGLVTVAVTGDVAAVTRAVYEAQREAGRINRKSLVCSHIIPCIAGELEHRIIGSGRQAPVDGSFFREEEKGMPEPVRGPELMTAPTRKEYERVEAEYGRRQAFAALRKLKVIELRDLARKFPELSIGGREISKANRKRLLEVFAALQEKI